MTEIIVNGASIAADATDASPDPQGWKIGVTIFPANQGFTLVDTGASLPADFTPQKYLWENGSLTANPTYAPPPEPAPIVPQTVASWQAKAALHNAGLLDAANAAIAASSGNVVLQFAWNGAASFDRKSPSVAAMAAGLSLTDAQVDALFIAAGQITI